jgi:hypothetical protein
MILRIIELVIPKSYFTESECEEDAKGFEALKEGTISMIFNKSQMTYY